MEHPGTTKQPDAIAAAFLVVLVSFSAISFFRRDLYAHSVVLYWGLDALKHVVLPATALAILARGYDVRARDYGIRGIAEHETWGQFIGLTIFLTLILDLIYYVMFYIAWLALRPDAAGAFYKEINLTGLAHIPSTFYLAVTAGFVEEVFFRGLPLLYLERKFGKALPRKSYILGTAFVFGLIHFRNGPHEVAATFAFGLLAAILYLRLRDLWPLIGAHILIDAIAFA